MAQVLGGDRHKWEAQAYDECVDEAQRILMAAADEWGRGDPETPATREVMQEILDVFVKQHFLKRPYGSKTD